MPSKNFSIFKQLDHIAGTAQSETAQSETPLTNGPHQPPTRCRFQCKRENIATFLAQCPDCYALLDWCGACDSQNYMIGKSCRPH